MSRKQLALLEPTLVRQALLDAVKKLSPMVQWRNPVMFIVWVSVNYPAGDRHGWRRPDR